MTNCKGTREVFSLSVCKHTLQNHLSAHSFYVKVWEPTYACHIGICGIPGGNVIEQVEIIHLLVYGIYYDVHSQLYML